MKLSTNPTGLLPLLDVFLKFITFLICFKPCGGSVSIQQSNKTYYIPGALRRDLPDPLFYTTYVPIVYEIDLPTWNASTLNIKWPENYSENCHESDTFQENWSHMACPVVHYMYDVAKRFHKSIFDWKSINSTSKASKIETFSCNEIGPHFNSYTLGHEEKADYLHETLKNCPMGSVIYEKLELESLKVNTSSFATMLRRFTEEYSSKRLPGYSRYASLTNAYSSLQGIQFLDYINSASKWNQAIATCDDERIPYTLVSPQKLGASLSEIEQTLAAKDSARYKLTIDAKDYSTYYKSNLADCVFTSKNTYLVRILVPVKNSELEYKLSLMTPIPFLRHYGKTAEICSYDILISPFLIENHTSLAIPSECDAGQLCQVPDIANRPHGLDYCLHALVKNSSSEILAQCETQCRHLNPHHLPFIRRISSDKYAVLGKSDMDLFISCEAQPFKVINPPMPIGALEVTLPCSCQLVHGQDILHSIPPCGNDLKLRNVAPLNWNPKSFNASNILIPENVTETLQSNEQFESNDGSLQFKIYALSAMVLILFCFNGVLLLTLTKLSTRLIRMEKLNIQSHFYEVPLPMHVRSNDD